MNRKALHWIGSSLKDLKAMPEDIQSVFGYALGKAQNGEKHQKAIPLKGFGSSEVLEIKESDPDGTYRAVYTVRFRKAIYVLHCFQKKSTRGIKTSQQDIDLIKDRLKIAERDARENGYE